MLWEPLPKNVPYSPLSQRDCPASSDAPNRRLSTHPSPICGLGLHAFFSQRTHRILRSGSARIRNYEPRLLFRQTSTDTESVSDHHSDRLDPIKPVIVFREQSEHDSNILRISYS